MNETPITYHEWNPHNIPWMKHSVYTNNETLIIYYEWKPHHIPWMKPASYTMNKTLIVYREWNPHHIPWLKPSRLNTMTLKLPSCATTTNTLNLYCTRRSSTPMELNSTPTQLSSTRLQLNGARLNSSSLETQVQQQWRLIQRAKLHNTQIKFSNYDSLTNSALMELTWSNNGGAWSRAHLHNTARIKFFKWWLILPKQTVYCMKGNGLWYLPGFDFNGAKEQQSDIQNLWSEGTIISAAKKQ